MPVLCKKTNYQVLFYDTKEARLTNYAGAWLNFTSLDWDRAWSNLTVYHIGSWMNIYEYTTISSKAQLSQAHVFNSDTT